MARINAKERKARRGKKRKGIEAHRVKHPTHPGQLMRSEGRKSRTDNRREQKERNREWGPQPRYP